MDRGLSELQKLIVKDDHLSRKKSRSRSRSPNNQKLEDS